MTKRHIEFHILEAGITVAITFLLLVGCAKNHHTAAEAQPTLSVQNAEEQSLPDKEVVNSTLAEKWGIQVEWAHLSAGGYMIDFRYRILDAAKAAPLLDRKLKPYLIDQASGAAFAVPNPPKVGQLRSGKTIKEGKIYYIFFANPGQYVKQGNKVSVVIGDCTITDIVVQ